MNKKELKIIKTDSLDDALILPKEPICMQLFLESISYPEQGLFNPIFSMKDNGLTFEIVFGDETYNAIYHCYEYIKNNMGE